MLPAVENGANHQVSVRVAHEIMQAINSGEFELGSRLPGERQLAERFEVSRPSLREALSALQFAGLVEARHGFGNVVVATEVTVTGPPARNTSRARVDLMEARLILEPEAVRLAAANPDREAMATARSLLDGMRVAAQVGAETDLNLHIALVNICPNTFIRQAAVALLEKSRTNHWLQARSDAWMNPELIEIWTRQHETTLDAIRNRQPEAAAAACREHLLTVASQITSRAGTSATDRANLSRILPPS